jgi:hypothetical protein
MDSMSLQCVAIVLACLLAGDQLSATPAVPQSAPNPAPTAASSVAAAPIKITSQHLPNAWRIHPKVISGGLPEGDAAFAELAALGVKTILSVDGATPDVETAARHRLKYVHLPHGYDGIPRSRGEELAKAVRDLPGPIYIHCHHGKHRSPAAAAVACVGAGLIESASADNVLKLAGTGEDYLGLYQSARAARRIDSARLDALSANFPERSAVPPLAEGMVHVEHTHDRLKQLAAAGWKQAGNTPALHPAHEALMLKEHYAEILRLPQLAAKPAQFQELMASGKRAAAELEAALEKADLQQANEALARINENCAACHQAFRDTPKSRAESTAANK